MNCTGDGRIRRGVRDARRKPSLTAVALALAAAGCGGGPRDRLVVYTPLELGAVTLTPRLVLVGRRYELHVGANRTMWYQAAPRDDVLRTRLTVNMLYGDGSQIPVRIAQTRSEDPSRWDQFPFGGPGLPPDRYQGGELAEFEWTASCGVPDPYSLREAPHEILVELGGLQGTATRMRKTPTAEPLNPLDP
jgi:hypothetical protein